MENKLHVSKLVLNLSSTAHPSGVGYRFAVRATEQWISSEIPEGKKGSSFDYPFRKDLFYTTPLISGTLDSVKEFAKVFFTRFGAEVPTLKELNVEVKFDKVRGYIEFANWNSVDLRNMVTLIVDGINKDLYTKPFVPTIIVFKEKHGDNFFIARTPDESNKVFLKVLRNRFNEKYWYGWMKDHKADKAKPAYTLDEINALPESMAGMKPKMIEELKKYEKDLEDAEEIRNTYRDMEKAILENDGVSARIILTNQGDGEYESFRIIEPETVD